MEEDCQGCARGARVDKSGLGWEEVGGGKRQAGEQECARERAEGR